MSFINTLIQFVHLVHHLRLEIQFREYIMTTLQHASLCHSWNESSTLTLSDYNSM